MKFSTYATLALAALPAVVASQNHLRKMQDEDEPDTRTTFLVGLENIDPCVHELVENGLTDDELRWIYSNYDEAQLIGSGWDATALANSDGDDGTHLWSELDANCPAEEIMISAIADTYDIHDLTFNRIFKEKETGTEDHRDSIKLCAEVDECAEFVEENPTAITFIYTSRYEEAHTDDTHPVGMKNDEMNFVVGLLNTDPCIQALATNGMSDHTLRWVYSLYSEEQLLATGWDPSSVPNSDGDDSTHLWSEIDPNCPAAEIALSALTDEDWRHDYVFNRVFLDKETGTEDHRESVFLCPVEDECAEFVEGNEHGITFFTKHRWAEEHSDDTLPVKDLFVPEYIDFMTAPES